jgi:hypothetical protein
VRFFCHTLISWGGCGEMTEIFLVCEATRQNFNSRRMTQAVLHHSSVTATSFATLIHECKLWIPKTATAPQKHPPKRGELSSRHTMAARTSPCASPLLACTCSKDVFFRHWKMSLACFRRLAELPRTSGLPYTSSRQLRAFLSSLGNARVV